MIQHVKAERFVGRQRETKRFNELLPLDQAEIALIQIVGPAGIGKTTLMDRFQDICLEQQVPFARINLMNRPPTEAIDFIANSFEQLISGNPGISLKSLRKQLEHYQKLEGKVLQSKTDIPEKKAELTSKFTGKLIKAGLALSPLGPLNVLMEVVGDDLVNSGVQALYGLFNNPGDIECYLNPLPFFTKDLVADLNDWPSRVVIFIDNYDHASKEFDDWLRSNFLSETEANVLFVVAGRQSKLPNEWESWSPSILRLVVPPLNEQEMRKYLLDRNIDQTELQDAIINYSGGNPYVMNIATDLALRSGEGIKILEKHRSELVNDMVKRLTEEIVLNLTGNLRLALQTCSVVRFFTEELMQDLINLENPRELYDELGTLSFVHPNSAGSGLMLDSTSRHFLETELKLRTPDRYKHLHEMAVKAFDARLEYAGVYDRPKFQIEKLYHLLRTNQEEAMSFFEDLFIRAIRLHNLQFCDSLLEEVKDPDIELVGKISEDIIRFCEAQLLQTRRKLKDARIIYENLMADPHLLPLLRLRTIAGLTLMLRDHDPEVSEKYAIEGIEIWEKIKPEGARYAVQIVHDLADTQRDTGRVKTSLVQYEKSVKLSQQFGYKFGEMDGLHGHGIALRRIGHLDESIQVLQQAIGMSREIHDENGEGSILHNLAMAYFKRGDFASAERCITDALPLLEKWGNQFGQVVAKYRLARVFRATAQYERALDAINSGLDILHTKGSTYFESEARLRQAEVLMDMGNFEDAEKALNECLKIAEDKSYYQWISAAYLTQFKIILRRDWLNAEVGKRKELLILLGEKICNSLFTSLRHNLYLLYSQAKEIFLELEQMSTTTPNAVCSILSDVENQWQTESFSQGISYSMIEVDLREQEDINSLSIPLQIENIKQKLSC